MGEWLEPTDARWQDTLRSARHDFYHLPSYVELAGGVEGGTPRAYYAEVGTGRLLIPLLIRSLDDVLGAAKGARDATSPYGYGGPVVTHPMSDSEFERAMEAFLDDGAQFGLVTSFLRTHPLLRQFARTWVDQRRVQVVTHGPTVSIDLRLEVDVLDRHIKAEYRRNIAKLRTAGFQARFDAWDDYPGFQAAYAQTMERHHAGPQYHLDAAFFVHLRGALGTSLHLCSVASPDGDFACGGLFTEVDGIVQYHLSATAERHRPMAPSKLMLYAVRRWAKERGAAVLHLGGGVGAKRDSLYSFKKGFGTHEHPFETIRIIHDHEAYGELTSRWLTDNQQTDFPDAAFFPLYRSTASHMTPSDAERDID